jgi:hypothetical protein
MGGSLSEKVAEGLEIKETDHRQDAKAPRKETVLAVLGVLASWR